MVVVFAVTKRKKPEPKSGTKGLEVQKKVLGLEHFDDVWHEISLEVLSLQLTSIFSVSSLFNWYQAGYRDRSLQHYESDMSRVKRICVFEHSVMTNFNCACPAIQRGQGSGFLSEGSSWLTACMSEQRRFWRDWTFAARIGDKYQIRLARPIWLLSNLSLIMRKSE